MALYHAFAYDNNSSLNFVGELGLEQVGLYSILFGLQERGHSGRLSLHGWAGAVA